MKILVVAPYFYPKIGGMENYALNIARGLKEKYHWDIVVATTNHEANEYREETIEGIKVYRLPYWFKFSNTPVNPLWFFSLSKIVRQERPDIIHGHSPVPFIADMALFTSQSVPYVMTYHAGSMLKGVYPVDHIIGFYEKYILNWCFRSAKAIISYSKEFIDSVLVPYKDKISVIPPGIDTELFVPAEKREPSSTILFVGRIEKTSEWKGIEFLLRAISIVKEKHPGVKLDLVGPGDAIEMYKLRAKKLGIEKNVTFSGGLTGKPLVKKYQQAAMHVLPSTTNAESFGMVLLEANACGTPVIGSKIGGIIQVIEDGKNGLLVEPRNEKALAKAINSLLDAPKKAETMGKAGRKKAVEEYQWSRQIDRYHELFTNIMSQRHVYQITAYYPPNLGGMQNCAKILSEAMAKRGMPVTVLTSNVSYIGSSHISPHKNLDVVYCSSLEFAHTPFSIEYIFELMKIKRPAVFHLHVANAFYVDLAYLAARIKRIPYVAHIHIDPDPSGAMGFLLPLYKNTVLKPLLKHASHIICLTQSQKDHFIKKYGLPKHKMTVIHNGVGKEYYIQRKPFQTPAKQILFVGRLSVQKNVPLLLEAIKMVQSDVELHIVGDGADKENILNKIKELQLNNVFLDGAKFGPELINMYRKADIFLFPTNNEGMSLALLEAMAAGVPVITSALDQNKELLKKGAIFVNTQDAKQYAQAIDSLVKDTNKLEEMSRTNQENAKAFSWDIVVDNILEAYKKI